VYVPLLRDPSATCRSSPDEHDPASVAVALRRAVGEVDPSQPLLSPRLMTRQLAGSLARPRFFSALVGGFAIAALLRHAWGLWGRATAAQAGLVAGIRFALGAQRTDVHRLVLPAGRSLPAQE
jgi:hypothetical protein